MKRILTLLIVLRLAPLAALHAAELKLASVLADHMVLERDKPVAVWGWADAGESVTVSFAGQSKSAIAAADGKWSLKLDALAASEESRSLTVTGKDGRKIEVKDVLVGEVWLGSGQSNMAMTVAGCYHFDEEKAAAKFPLIRHYRESSGPAELPQAEGKGAWQTCTPDTVGGFSAALYFFGREIHKEVGVPVGLINTSVGGTPIESWVAAEVQSSDPETKANYDTRLGAHRKFDPAQAPALHQKPNPNRPRAFGGKGAEGMKKEITSNNGETLDETINRPSHHPKAEGKTPFRPLNPHQPTPTADSWAGGLEKENPFSAITRPLRRSSGANRRY